MSAGAAAADGEVAAWRARQRWERSSPKAVGLNQLKNVKVRRRNFTDREFQCVARTAAKGAATAVLEAAWEALSCGSTSTN